MEQKILTIDNFITDEEATFWRTYAEYAVSNPSMQVSLMKGGKQTKVDRLYYSVASPFWLFDKVRKVAEQNYHFGDITFRPDAYAQIMHYKAPSEGLDWHKDQNLGCVSVSINLSPDGSYEGGEFEAQSTGTKVPGYCGMVMYDRDVRHSVAPVTKGEKFSLVLWLPYKGQEVSGKTIAWRYE